MSKNPILKAREDEAGEHKVRESDKGRESRKAEYPFISDAAEVDGDIHAERQDRGPQTHRLRTLYFRHRGIFLQAVMLMTVWLVLSGHYDVQHVLFGVLSVILVVSLNYRMHRVPLAPGEEPGSHHIIIHRLIIYLFWLLWQIIQSGLYVAYIVLHPQMPVNPMLVRFKSRQPNVLARVILGNSITLTPGTITLEIDGDEFTVHALSEDTEKALISGDMEARVGRLYLYDCRSQDMCTDVELFTSGRGR